MRPPTLTSSAVLAVIALAGCGGSDASTAKKDSEKMVKDWVSDPQA